MSQLSKVELSYLSGLWDGEGSFMIIKTDKENGKYNLSAKSVISSTNKVLFDRVVTMLRSANIERLNLENRQHKANWRTLYGIRIETNSENVAFIKMLKPYLHGKKPVATAVLRFLNRRSRLGKLSEADFTDYEAVSRLNNRGVEKSGEIAMNLDMPKINELDVAYLSGLFDGEGSFSITKVREKGREKYRLSSVSSITNCDPKIINRALEIMRGLGVTGRMYRIDKKNANRAPCYTIEIKRLELQAKLLKSVSLYLVGKKQVASLMLEFIESRLKNKMTGRYFSVSPYTEREIELFDIVAKLNKKGVSKPEKIAVYKSCELGETPAMDNTELNLALSEQVNA